MNLTIVRHDGERLLLDVESCDEVEHWREARRRSQEAAEEMLSAMRTALGNQSLGLSSACEGIKAQSEALKIAEVALLEIVNQSTKVNTWALSRIAMKATNEIQIDKNSEWGDAVPGMKQIKPGIYVKSSNSVYNKE